MNCSILKFGGSRAVNTKDPRRWNVGALCRLCGDRCGSTKLRGYMNHMQQFSRSYYVTAYV